MTDIFKDPADTPGVVDQDTQVSIDDLVGEGKRFPTLQALVKKIENADLFIGQLTEENKGLRSVSEKQTNAEQNLQALKEEIAALKQQINKPAEPSPNTTGELTTEKLEEIVSGLITKKEQSRTASENINTVNAKMVEVFGSLDKATEVFNQKASEVNMTRQELKALASKSPTAFFQIIGLTKDKVNKGPNLQHSVTNTAALPNNPGQPKVGTHEYYNAIRRERGNAAFFSDVKLQQEILEAKKNGTYD